MKKTPQFWPFQHYYFNIIRLQTTFPSPFCKTVSDSILYHKYDDSVLFCLSMAAESSQENRTKDSNDTITDQW